MSTIRNLASSVLGLALVVTACPLVAQVDRYATAREQMVQQSIVAGGIREVRVIESMRTVPRHEFVSGPHRRNSYYDMALPIGSGQTISPPYIVAFMTESLDPQPTDRVLEIGTGSGYQAAILSSLVADVFSIEIVESLGRRAAKTLERLPGYENVHTRIGDGYLGWPEQAPFQKIIVTCSPESIPKPLVDQLAEGGRMIIPLGERFQQELYLFRKVDGKMEQESLEATFFVPMTGQAETLRERLIDESVPGLEHTGFEATLGESDLPAGWFYARQVRVSDQLGSTEGERALLCENTESGRPSHVMQAFGIDGQQIASMNIRFSAKGLDLRQGRDTQEMASVIVDFYGERRASLGSKTLGGMQGSFDWEEKAYTISVPRKARLAIIGIGLFGGTGKMAIDDIRVQASAKRDAENR